jgi:hypothetical protein
LISGFCHDLNEICIIPQKSADLSRTYFHGAIKNLIDEPQGISTKLKTVSIFVYLIEQMLPFTASDSSSVMGNSLNYTSFKKG